MGAMGAMGTPDERERHRRPQRQFQEHRQRDERELGDESAARPLAATAYWAAQPKADRCATACPSTDSAKLLAGAYPAYRVPTGVVPTPAPPSDRALSAGCQPTTSTPLGKAAARTGRAAAPVAVTGMSDPFS